MANSLDSMAARREAGVPSTDPVQTTGKAEHNRKAATQERILCAAMELFAAR